MGIGSGQQDTERHSIASDIMGDEPLTQGPDAYIDLMKRAVLASIYDQNGWYVLGTLDSNERSLKGRIKSFLVRLAWQRGFLLVKARIKPGTVEGWGLLAYTMIGKPRLDNIENCIVDVIRSKVEGDLIETGVWRGGATIFMRACLKAYGDTSRIVWVADSFEGLPSMVSHPDADKDDAATKVHLMNDGGPMQLGLAVSLEQVQENFRKFDLLDDQVRFLKGWFEDTLPSAPIKKLAVLRLDGDMYKSTMDALNALYHKVSKGGYVIVDDYGSWPHCKRAIDDFRREHRITDELVRIDEHAVFRKVT